MFQKAADKSGWTRHMWVSVGDVWLHAQVSKVSQNGYGLLSVQWHPNWDPTKISEGFTIECNSEAQPLQSNGNPALYCEDEVNNCLWITHSSECKRHNPRRYPVSGLWLRHKGNNNNPLWLQLLLESLSSNATAFPDIQSGCFWMLNLHSTVWSMKHGVVE